jgi:hypothetical protein
MALGYLTAESSPIAASIAAAGFMVEALPAGTVSARRRVALAACTPAHSADLITAELREASPLAGNRASEAASTVVVSEAVASTEAEAVAGSQVQFLGLVITFNYYVQLLRMKLMIWRTSHAREQYEA